MRNTYASAFFMKKKENLSENPKKMAVKKSKFLFISNRSAETLKDGAWRIVHCIISRNNVQKDFCAT